MQTIFSVSGAITENITNAVEETGSLKESIEMTQEAMENLVTGTNDTVNAIESQKESTEKINLHIVEVDQSVKSIMAELQKAEENLDAGNVVMQELLHQVQVSEKASETVTREMKELQEYASKMQDIMGLIISVANQTGMLALNASIEAARAGEAGRGFAVVAEQIRELSENTRRETEQISAILEELTRNADQTVEAVEKSVAVSSEQDRMISGVADQFDEMNRNVNELVGDISDIDNMIESLSTANNQIVDNIMQLSATTEEVTAAAQQSSEITERNYTDSVDAQQLLRGVLEISHQMDKYINV